jgi:hypothetical protein
MYDQSSDTDQSQDVQPELGGTTSVVTSTKVRMYDQS